MRRDDLRLRDILESIERIDRPMGRQREAFDLKRDRPVARLLPPVPAGEDYPQQTLRGSVEILGDILEPVLPAEAWDAVRGRGWRVSPV